MADAPPALPSNGRPEPSEPPPSVLLHFGSAAAVSALGAAAATLPSGLRVNDSGAAATCGALAVWVALVSAAFVPMLGAVLLLRSARGGLRILAVPSALPNLAAFALWLLLESAVLFLLGAILRATTHHHALAGVTFAIAAVVCGALSMLVARRVVGLYRAGSVRVRALLGAAALVLALGFALLASRFSHTGGARLAASLGPSLVDGFAFFIAAGFASRTAFARIRVLSLLGPPLAVTVLLLGFSALRSCPTLAEAIDEQAPAFAPIARLVQPTSGAGTPHDHN